MTAVGTLLVAFVLTSSLHGSVLGSFKQLAGGRSGRHHAGAAEPAPAQRHSAVPAGRDGPCGLSGSPAAGQERRCPPAATRGRVEYGRARNPGFPPLGDAERLGAAGCGGVRRAGAAAASR
ncbi:MAG: hypothetical protein MZV70_41850 [Desulfobacterales bacterium]|nr:hypothetical protein [Desulfobacterales bacterium]